MSIIISYKQVYDLDKDPFFSLTNQWSNLKAAFILLSSKDDKFLFFRYHIETFRGIRLVTTTSANGYDSITRQVHFINQKTPRYIQKVDFDGLNIVYLFEVGTKELLCTLSDLIKQEER